MRDLWEDFCDFMEGVVVLAAGAFLLSFALIWGLRWPIVVLLAIWIVFG